MRRLALLACLIALPSFAANAAGPGTPGARAEARELLAFSIGLETSLGKEIGRAHV